MAAAAGVFAIGLGRAANYDEGVYVASLRALQGGDHLGDEVFASQPPGFYLLLELIGLGAGSSIDAIRAGLLIVALAGVAAAYGLGRAFAGRAAGLGAAAVLAVSSPYPSQAAQVEAETGAVVLAIAGLAAAAAARRRSGPWLPLAAGAGFAAAVSVKLLAVTALVPLAALAPRLGGRRVALVAAGAAVVTAALVAGYWSVLGELWESVVGFHADARGGPGLGENADRILHFLDLRTPFGWLVPAGAAATVVAWVRRRPLGTSPLWLWAVASALFLVGQRPLLDHHTVLLAAALAVAAGASLGAAAARLDGRTALAAASVLALLVAAGFYQEARRLQRNDVPEPPGVRRAVSLLRAETPPDALVVTDLPVVAVRAGRRVPGRLVDTSSVRFESGSLTRADVLGAVDLLHPSAAVAGREFRNDAALLAGLRSRFGQRRDYGGVTVYLRPRRAR